MDGVSSHTSWPGSSYSLANPCWSKNQFKASVAAVTSAYHLGASAPFYSLKNFNRIADLQIEGLVRACAICSDLYEAH